MVAFSIINPIDQPTGRKRLLGELKAALQDKRFTSLYIIVAYAKSGPLLRLQSLIEAWCTAGNKIHAIFGVDQQGTTAQALDFAISKFSSAYVTQEQNLTFHPKIYAFIGPSNARLFIGSHNLTVGGTETNFESGIQLDFDLVSDPLSLQPFLDSWAELMPSVCPATKPLTKALLTALMSDGSVLDEIVAQRRKTVSSPAHPAPPKPPKSGLAVKPPSALPRRKPSKPVTPVSVVQAPVTASIPADLVSFGAQGLAIQIKPHHNGEIFLSVTAALQNPAFFRWPFTGFTVPKKPGNPAYPQLSPDPIVSVTVYGAGLAPQLILPSYPLNTVYYSKKSEIRITAKPLVGVVPDYSIMVIQNSDVTGIDYDIIIHRPDSPDFSSWLSACNQTMPGGGQAPRKFGWF
jgi:hypothetical protein